MARPPTPDRSALADRITTVFHVGLHTLRVSKVNEGRWTYSVDDAEASGTFPTQAAAWEAGVRAADGLDTPARR